MYSLKNKIIFITGATSGIGKACAEHFAEQGAKLIITGRRLERLTHLAAKLSESHQVDVLPIQLDVKKSEQVDEVVKSLPEEWKKIQVLVNNAGLALTTDAIHEADIKNWDIMIDTNVKGLLYVTRAILPTMLKEKTGHIINIGSIAGRACYPLGNVYSATKYAVRAITEGLRLDLLGSSIRVSEVAPGAVETEFSEVRWKDKARAKAFYEDFTPLKAEDIADAVIYCATRKPHVNIAEMVVYPTDQASVSIKRSSTKGGSGPFDS